MTDDRRRLPTGPLPLGLPEPNVDVREVFRLPGEATLTSFAYSRQDLVTVQHLSISPELADVRKREAEAAVEVARAEHATLHVERSRQVYAVAGVVGVVAVTALVCIYLTNEPGRAQWMAGVVVVFGTIFGGAFLVLRRPPRAPK